MENKEIAIEKVFGNNAKEKTKNIIMQELLVDDETKSLFEDVCEEIRESDSTDREFVEIIKVLPHDLKNLLSVSIKNREIGQLFRQAEYEEFVLDVNAVDKNGENEFEKRYSKIRTVDYRKFLKKRILTREEIEFLIGVVAKKSGLAKLSYKEKHETYSGNNVYLKNLVKAHKILSESKHLQARGRIKEKVNKILLANVLEKVKVFNKTGGLEK